MGTKPQPMAAPIKTTFVDRRPSLMFSETFECCTAALVYSFTSISIILLNRRLLTVGFPCPIFVTGCQQGIGLVCVIVLGVLGKLWPALKVMPSVTPDLKTMRELMPLSFAFIGTIVFSNMCLSNVFISTYQTARSMTLVFNVVVSRLLHDASRDKKLESEIKSEDDFKSEVDSKDSEDDSTRPTEMEELVDEGRAKPYERQSVATRG
eukprot:Selendium_serpulae@DN4669_c0_g1_i3.p1